MCTHGNTHLADGLVKGKTIECPKHNGRFNLVDGSPARAPICRGLATYPIEERGDRLYINVAHAGGVGARAQKTYRFRVVSNRSVATFIKELVLEPVDAAETIAFTPGDYLQLDIPAYDAIRFRDFDIPEPFATVWKRQHVFDLVARNLRRVAATTTRWPATNRQKAYCGSTCASPRRLRGRIALLASAPATSSTSSPAISSLASGLSAISISSRPNAK